MAVDIAGGMRTMSPFFLYRLQDVDVHVFPLPATGISQ